MNLNEVMKALILKHGSYPAVKLFWECQLPLEPDQLPLMSPSHYIKELSLTTEERLNLLCHQQKKLEFWGCGSELTVVPAIIVFQNYEPSKDYSVTISIRNISGRMQKVTILMEETDEFSFDKNTSQITRIASGMIFKPTINFHPHEDRDIFQKLIIMTKQNRFAIPILGIGGKGILNPPDVIDFLTVPVKCLKTRLITTTNIGTRVARFLLTTTGPFCVAPERGVVNPKESFSMEVSFHSPTTHSTQGKLIIHYENGEQVTVVLKAEAINCCMYISPPKVTFYDTYIGLRTQASVEIVNGTSAVATFKWYQHPSLAAAVLAKQKQKQYIKSDRHNHYSLGRQNAGSEAARLGEPSVICINCETPLLRAEEAASVDLFFPAEDFLIEPVCGEVQPFSSKECFIFFTPYQPMQYDTEAFCDLTGQENRLTLSLVGNGIKPKFTFGFDENFIPLPLAGGHSNKSETVTEEITVKVSIADVPAGDFKIALFGKAVPNTVRNFKTICTDGIGSKTYIGCRFHRIIKDFMIQGGDIVSGDGTGSTSVFGIYFDDENFHIKHTGPGFVSMANSGPNTNGCQFFITTDATPWLDGHHVVFGKVVDGLNLIKTIEKLPVTDNNRPISDVVITECKAQMLTKTYDLQLDSKD
ncbi:unnamed protein product [Allacma fusca]|uniref:Peptidyl-prolyl cis-trans isomerase, rhodopsin-specific isozyme n=1 Tax=Allacma fusca TaxID=39272 RepID=A0A8J2NHU8_9HEXA|nr:unnamed protein product [Allacma fusca]